MKKAILKIIITALSVMTVTAGCTGSMNALESIQPPVPATENIEQSTVAAEPKSLKEYVDLNKENGKFDPLLTKENDTVTGELDATEDTLIFTFKYKEGAKISQDMKKHLSEGLNQVEELYKSFASTIEKNIGSDIVKIEIKYIDYEGNPLAEKVYSNK